MTSGPEHYRKAELLLASADDNFLRYGDAGSALPAAQVHATLALAAAMAERIIIQLPDSRAGEEWSAAMDEPHDEDDDTCYAGTGAPMAQPGPEPLFAPPAEI